MKAKFFTGSFVGIYKEYTNMPITYSNKLTATAIKSANPKDTPYKLTDGDGMYLLVNPTGGKYWHLAYRYNNKQKLLALGVYPDVTLKEARIKREAARKLLKEGTDPSEAKKEEKRLSLLQNQNTFEAIAYEWLSIEEWKQAAVGNSMLLDTSNELINTLQELLDLYKENTQHLETRIAQLENRRIGRPRELKKTLGALALYNKSKRGRPKNNYADKGSIWAYTNEDLARDLRHRVDLIKTEHWIKTDKAALTFLYKKLPLRTRTRLIEYDAKLLSKHRKLIAKIE